MATKTMHLLYLPPSPKPRPHTHIHLLYRQSSAQISNWMIGVLLPRACQLANHHDYTEKWILTTINEISGKEHASKAVFEDPKPTIIEKKIA